MILSDSISIFSIIITTIVIICMTFAFSFLFWLYSKYKCKVIDLGGEDEKLTAELNKDYEVYCRKANVEASVEEFIEHKKKQNRLFRIITDIIYSLFILILFSLSCVALIFRVWGQQFYFGHTTYLTIQTGSMSKKNPVHQNLNQLPNNQIKQYALIGIDKVKEQDIKLYDIVAFKHEGAIYVHRVVQILESNGKRAYTTQGDANTGSFSFEIDIPFDNILGKYNGYQSIGLGVILTYLQSESGIIALIFAMLMLVIIDLSEVYITKCYKKRSNFILQHLFQMEGRNEK